MHVYLLLFLVGAIGFVTMALLGSLHVGGVHGHSAIGHHGAGALGHAGAGGQHAALASHHATALATHGHTVQGAHQPLNASAEPSGAAALLQSLKPLLILSPIDIFGMCLGAGAVGIALEKLVAAPLLTYLAIAGALIVDFGLIKPLVNFLLGFGSKPSEGLEGMIAHEARAITSFDTTGKGLVSLVLDGQNVQLLAKLEESELAHGVHVAKGDSVIVVEVDPAKNVCRVTRELTP